MSTGATTETTSLEEPRLLAGRYEVGELIGRGGMAEVHAGYDTRLGREVAIKILRFDLARDSSFIMRFRREAQAAARLNHPSIVAIFDSGEDHITESGGARLAVPFIVMERVTGRTLREVLLQDGPYPAKDAARIMSQVIRALGYSHANGIIHRDVKPGNIMVSTAGSVKVMDFGIARAVSDTAATLTNASVVIGTAQYISPEQAQGKDVDARSDLYAAGCVLFELLTGRPPFTGDSPLAIAYQQVGQAPLPPSTYAKDIPENLDVVALHALAKKPADRYQSAADFSEDLEAVRSGLPISAAAHTGAGRHDETGPALADPAQDPAESGGTSRDSAPTRTGPETTSAGAAATAAAVGTATAAGHDDPDTAPTTTVTRRRTRLTSIGRRAGAAIGVGAAARDRLHPPGATNDGGAATREGTDGAGSRTESAADPDTPPGTHSDPPTGPLPPLYPGAGRTRRNRLTLVVLAVLATLLTVAAVASGGNIGGMRDVDVPKVIGLTQDAATSELSRLGFATAVENVADQASPGTVISQDPEYGARRGPGSTIALRVSSGPRPVSLQDLKNFDQTSARQALASVGLNVGRITQVDSYEVVAGHVVSTDPRAGTSVPEGSSVNLLVSSGKVVVPKVTGMSEDEARTTLAKVGLQAHVTLVRAYRRVGTVAEQTYEGERVTVGTVINLSVVRARPTPIPTKTIIVTRKPGSTDGPDRPDQTSRSTPTGTGTDTVQRIEGQGAQRNGAHATASQG